MEDIQKLQLVVVHLVRQCRAQIKVVSSVSCSVFRDVFTPISLYSNLSGRICSTTFRIHGKAQLIQSEWDFFFLFA